MHLAFRHNERAIHRLPQNISARRIRINLTLLIISFYAGLTLADLAPLAAAELPVREPGLWQITTISAATGMTSAEACIGPTDSLVAPAGKKCSAPEVQTSHDQIIVNVSCSSNMGMEFTSTLFTGDFKTWYRGIVKITYDPPFGGVANLGVTIDARRISESCGRR